MKRLRDYFLLVAIAMAVVLFSCETDDDDDKPFTVLLEDDDDGDSNSGSQNGTAPNANGEGTQNNTTSNTSGASGSTESPSNNDSALDGDEGAGALKPNSSTSTSNTPSAPSTDSTNKDQSDIPSGGTISGGELGSGDETGGASSESGNQSGVSDSVSGNQGADSFNSGEGSGQSSTTTGGAGSVTGGDSGSDTQSGSSSQDGDAGQSSSGTSGEQGGSGDSSGSIESGGDQNGGGSSDGGSSEAGNDGATGDSGAADTVGGGDSTSEEGGAGGAGDSSGGSSDQSGNTFFYPDNKSAKESDFIRVAAAKLSSDVMYSDGKSSAILKAGVEIAPYYICKHEVTKEEYNTLMNSNLSAIDRTPIGGVNWCYAVIYCNERSKKEGRTPCYTFSNGDVVTLENSGKPTQNNVSKDATLIQKWKGIRCNFSANGYRLPSEYEWEWAASGLGKSYIYSGSDKADEVAWYKGKSDNKVQEVMYKKKPNKIGTYDMTGNVTEYCWGFYCVKNGVMDKYFENDPYTPDEPPSKNVFSTSNEGDIRVVVRGGAYTEIVTANYERSTIYFSREFDNGKNGFRVVVTACD